MAEDATAASVRPSAIEEANAFLQWCESSCEGKPGPPAELNRGDGEEPHDHAGDDESAKWALYANRIRMKYHVCSLPEEVCTAINENLKSWWDWDPYTGNCHCEGCSNKRPRIKAKYLYTEKLVRRKSWYEENEKAGLLEIAAEYWATFFGPLQTYCLQCNSLVHGIKFSHFKNEMVKLGVDFSALGNLCHKQFTSTSYAEPQRLALPPSVHLAVRVEVQLRLGAHP